MNRLVKYMIKNGYFFRIEDEESIKKKFKYSYEIGDLHFYESKEILSGLFSLKRDTIYYVTGKRVYETPYSIIYNIR